MDEEAFVEAIKERRELYDKSNKFYMDSRRKDKIWQDISEQFNVDAKKKWTAIRDRYVREKRKNTLPSGSAAKFSQSWYLFPFLEFLGDCIKPRRMKENTESEENDSIFQSNISSDVLSTEESSSFERSSAPSASPNPRKRKLKGNDDEVGQLLVQTLHQFSDKLKNVAVDDEDGYFLKSIRCEMQKMSEEQKSKFKIDILMRADDAVRRSSIN